MMNQQRIIYVKNIIIYIITTIYVIALHFYNIKIYRIQNRYSNKIYAALETVKDQDFLIYFALGLFFIILLIYSAISSFRDIDIIGVGQVIISVVIYMILLIVLLIIYSNPVLTSRSTCNEYLEEGKYEKSKKISSNSYNDVFFNYLIFNDKRTCSE